MSKRLLVLVATFLTACAEVPAAARGEVGSPAPEYSAVTLGGDTVSLASLRGEPVLLNIWATWCPPCRKEMPDLQALHEELGPRGLRVIGVSVDASGADDLVREFLSDYGVTFEILRDPAERIATTFATQGVPVTILIGSDGTILWRKLGPVSVDDPQLRDALDRAIRS